MRGLRRFGHGIILLIKLGNRMRIATFYSLPGNAVRRVSLRVDSGTRIGHVERQEPAVVNESP